MTGSHEDEGHPLSEWASHKLMMVKMMMTVVVMGMMAMTVKMMDTSCPSGLPTSWLSTVTCGLTVGTSLFFRAIGLRVWGSSPCLIDYHRNQEKSDDARSYKVLSRFYITATIAEWSRWGVGRWYAQTHSVGRGNGREGAGSNNPLHILTKYGHEQNLQSRVWPLI